MRTIPIRISDTDYQIFYILGEQNISRIKAKDPSELVIENLGPPWNSMRLSQIILMYATEQEIAKLDQCRSFSDIQAMLKELSSGWKYCPELGDYDGQYKRIKMTK